MNLPRGFLMVAVMALGPTPSWGQPVIWLEAESGKVVAGTAGVIDEKAADFGAMAKTEASGDRFVRLSPGGGLSFHAAIREAGERAVWVRAFPLEFRRVTALADGKEIGTTAGAGGPTALTWQKVGKIALTAGDHAIELRAAAGNNNFAYVDTVALLADVGAMPLGRGAEEVVRLQPAERIEEDFSAAAVSSFKDRWKVEPPPGEDAVVEVSPKEDGGVLHIHNGAGKSYRLTSLKCLNMRPGDQLTVRVRVRKGTLCESLSVVVPGVGSFSPQLYRQFQTTEHTWLAPPAAAGPVLLQLVGRGGGDTYISSIEAFRPDPPVSSFDTGRFLPAPNLQREGRLFEIERYVLNPEAFSDEVDKDGDGLWSLCRLSREDNTPYFSRGTVLKSDSVKADRATPDEGCPPLHVRVGPLEPGRYQVYLSQPGRALAYSADGKHWRRFAGTGLPSLAVIAVKSPFFEFWLDDRFAEPSNPGPTYVDYIRFMPIEDPAFTMAPALAPGPLAKGKAERQRVALTVENPSGEACREPIRSGVPIPQGDLADADHARLVDEQGREVPAALQTTGIWPDGSVKWLLMDAVIETPAKGRRPVWLEYGRAVQRAAVPGPFSLSPDEQGLFALHLTNGSPPKRTSSEVYPKGTGGGAAAQKGGLLTVDAGPMRWAFDPRRGGAFSVSLAEAPEPVLALEGATFRASDGREWRSSLEAKAGVEVEEVGPFRATVRVRGNLHDQAGPGPLVFDMRVHLFAGRPEMVIEYGFFALAEPATVSIAEASLRFRGSWPNATARFGFSSGSGDPIPVSRAPRLLQTGEEAYGCAGPFPFVLSDGRGAVLQRGDRAPGWMRVEGGRAPALFCLPCFWQQSPKALSADAEGATVYLWPPREGGAPFIAHAGAGKSHRLCVSLAPAADPGLRMSPLLARCDPEWYCASGAFEEMVPRRADRYPKYEAIIDAAFEKMLEDRAGYGMENWGDVWQEGYVPGAKTWSNQEWDLVNSWFIAFVRTGDRRFLDFAHEAARHYADVDCIHYSTNPGLAGGAWMHAHTSLRGHQLEDPNFAHAGWVEGMLNIYHLTGDRRGVEAAKGIASYICRRAPQRDSLPPGGPPYALAIQRPAGWPLTTLCLVYRETWDPVCLQAARRIVDYARRCQDPDRGIWDAQVGHEVPYRGGCVFAYTLFRGLRLFSDITGEDRARQDYVKAARWIFGEMWRPGHLYLYEQCPLHEPGSKVPFTLSEMAGYATRLSNDPIYAAIGYDALREHGADGTGSWMVDSARRSQWANGIVQQVPRMLYDWERTGLTVDERVALVAAESPKKIPMERPCSVRLLLRNETDAPMQGLSASCLIRGDWKAEVARCPSTVPAHGEAEVELSCQAPPPIAQYELQNDLAHVHAAVRYRQGGTPKIVWGYTRLDIAKPLEVVAPASVALKPGTDAAIRLIAINGEDPRPRVEARAETDMPGITLGEVEVSPGAEAGSVTIRLRVSAAAKAQPGAGVIRFVVRSGRRQAAAEVPAKIGRFRAVMIEGSGGGEWRYPFDVLRAYPGIAAEYLPTNRISDSLPDTPEDIAARWEVVIVGDTGKGASAFAPRQLDALAAFVRQGGGLMVVAGAKSYTPGGYAETPLKDVLPVDMSNGAYAKGDVGVQVLDKGTKLFEGYDPVFPPFGAHQLLKTKAGARVLAQFTDGTPFVTLGQAGKGRVLALGAIWNHASGRAFRQSPNYGRFVGRAVRWVAKDLD